MKPPLVNKRVIGYYHDDSGTEKRKLVFVLDDGQWCDALAWCTPGAKLNIDPPIRWEEFDPYANFPKHQ